ncbi:MULTISPECIES: hypothetical protein [Arthrobacter]|uniref:Uncharacterized protein n=1 Tax=Arthrobacter terricola TaxID=2547396 RepID=A0A4R5KPJ7_9MICC|nr:MULTISPECIES: hypothetical protein [Arthrobacter]MBT8161046.1 hypothetical protein [Arthrobacter sp. GN70]TDF96905.1 hypothetical protein E1809_09290 [Arthrobacter terricola]
MKIFDKLVRLAKGSHVREEQGACVMEYVSMVAGEAFSDRPKCTEPVVFGYAWRANDNMTDDGRQRLLELVPRLLSASPLNPIPEVGATITEMAFWRTRQFELEERLREAWVDKLFPYTPIPEDDARFNALNAVLDEYDKLREEWDLGPASCPVNADDLTALVEAVGAR